MEYISRDEVVQEKESADLRLSLVDAGWESGKREGWATLPLHNTQQAKQALAAYQSHAEIEESSPVELLQRVDDYT